jgi:hypothetical protein
MPPNSAQVEKMRGKSPGRGRGRQHAAAHGKLRRTAAVIHAKLGAEDLHLQQACGFFQRGKICRRSRAALPGY